MVNHGNPVKLKFKKSFLLKIKKTKVERHEENAKEAETLRPKVTDTCELTGVHLHKHTCICTCAHIHVHTHAHTPVCMHTHTCTHTHTHTHPSFRALLSPSWKKDDAYDPAQIHVTPPRLRPLYPEFPVTP